MVTKKFLLSVILLMILAAVVLTGCKTTRQKGLNGQGKISPAELRDELDRFEYFFINSMTQTANEINTDVETRRTKRESQENRSRIIRALYAMMAPDDPVVAYVDTWGLVVRLRQYLEGVEGQRLYRQQQQKVVTFISMVEIEIERIGKLFIDPKQFEQVRNSIETFALENPVTGNFSNLIVFASQQEEATQEEGGVLAATLRIPMAPIRALEGVDKTGDAIVKVRDSVDRFTGVAQQFPESARLQMSILMDDFEETQMTQSFLTSLSQFSQSSEKLVEVLDSMPDELRAELLTVLEESEQTQLQLQATIKTAEQAAVQLDKTLGELQTTSVSINQTAAQATEAAIAWQAASDSIQDLVTLFKTKSPRAPDDPPPFGMRDFDTMLTNAGQTADKVTNTITELQDAINTGANSGVEKEVRSLIDHAALRLFQLILVMFALIVVLTVLRRKLKKT